MEIAVIRFPGTNNEHETVRALQSFNNVEADIIDHKDTELLGNYDGFWLAGGFSFADVLRAGAIASRTQIVHDIVNSGKPILGVCNGFQIMTEANILPGALMPNNSTRFICKWVNLKISDEDLFGDLNGEILKLPIAHFEGKLYLEPSDEYRPFVKYSNERGVITQEANPNGSFQNIAGTVSEDNRFIGLMPHPERASFKYQGSTDGRIIIDRFLEEVKH